MSLSDFVVAVVLFGCVVGCDPVATPSMNTRSSSVSWHDGNDDRTSMNEASVSVVSIRRGGEALASVAVWTDIGDGGSVSARATSRGTSHHQVLCDRGRHGRFSAIGVPPRLS